jgi:hypothetical protein
VVVVEGARQLQVEPVAQVEEEMEQEQVRLSQIPLGLPIQAVEVVVEIMGRHIMLVWLADLAL